VWSIVEVGPVWFLLWDGEIFEGFYYSLEAAVERLLNWYKGY
jgi:hypothetical protein